MAKLSFSEENVKKSAFDFPKLKLKKGEVARIVLLEDPEFAYVHDMRKPKIENGVPQKEQKKRRDDSVYEDFIYEFVSRPVCLGDLGTLEANGNDPKNCPVCAEAASSDRATNPKRRFALHAVRYSTKPGSPDLITPFSVQTLVWSFTDKVFTKIFELKKEWGDLRTHDLVLKCENEIFQNYDISVAAKAAWMDSDDQKKLTVTTFRENQAEDLELFCGSKKEKKYLEMDLDQIRAAWNIATGTASATATTALSTAAATEALDAGLGDLLNGGKAAPAAQSGEASLGFDDLSGNAEAPKDAEGWLSSSSDVADILGTDPGAADAPAASTSDVSMDDLDSLLN